MSIYFPFSFLSLGAILILNSGDVTGKHVHPLMLFKILGNSLRRPYDLFVHRSPHVPTLYHFTAEEDNETRLLFCGATGKNLDRIEELQETARQGGIETDVVSKYCLFEWEDSMMNTAIEVVFFINRDFPECEVEPEPLISRILSDENTEPIRCGPEDKGSLYRYGYQIWLKEELFHQVKDHLDSSLTMSKVHPKNRIIDYEIFRICYDSRREVKQVLYTKHTVISPKLLQQPYLTQQITKQYPISKDNFDLKELNFNGRAFKYKKYLSDVGTSTTPETPLSDVGTSTTPENPYILNQLVSETYFSFSLWQKPLSHFVNYDLINKKLYDLWNEVTITCKNYAAQYANEIDIYTKTFNMDGKLTLAPQIWIKVIHLHKQAVAIIANNEMDENLNGVISETYCDNIDYCETFNFGTASFNHDVQQYIKCCAINEEIKKLFNFNPSLNIEGVLWIPNLNI